LINQLNTYPGLWERIFSYFGWPLYGTKLVQEFNECSSSPEKNCQQLKKKLNTNRKATIQAQQARRNKALEVSQSILKIQQEKQVSTVSSVSTASRASTAQQVPIVPPIPTTSTVSSVQQKKNQVLNVSSPSVSTASKSLTTPSVLPVPSVPSVPQAVPLVQSVPSVPQAVQEKNKQVSKVQSLPILTQADKKTISTLSLQVTEANIINILDYLKTKFSSSMKDDETLLNSEFIKTWLKAYGDNQNFSPVYTYVATLLYNSQKLGRTMGRLFRSDKKGSVIDRYKQRVTKFIELFLLLKLINRCRIEFLLDSVFLSHCLRYFFFLLLCVLPMLCYFIHNNINLNHYFFRSVGMMVHGKE